MVRGARGEFYTGVTVEKGVHRYHTCLYAWYYKDLHIGEINPTINV